MSKKLIRMIWGSRKSMTMWFNGLMASVALGLPDVLTMLPQLQAYVPDNVYKQLMAAVLVGNILLRFKTNKGLDQK